MDIESRIHPTLSCSDLTSPAGVLFSSDSQTAGGSSIARSRSRPLTPGSSTQHPPSRPSAGAGLPTLGPPGGQQTRASKAQRVLDTDEEMSPRRLALLMGRPSALPSSGKRKGRYLRSSSLGLSESRSAESLSMSGNPGFSTFIPCPASPRTRMSNPCADVFPGSTQSTRAPGPAHTNSSPSLDPSVSLCGGVSPTVVEQPPRGSWAGRGEFSYAVTEEAGEPSRSVQTGPPATSSGSGAVRHSSRRHHRHADPSQPQASHQRQQRHSSVSSSMQHGSKYSAATSCSSRSSAGIGNAAAALAGAATPAAAHGPSSGMYVHSRNRNSADNSITLSSTSTSRSTYAASTQHSERDAHRSYPPERRGSGSGGSRDRSCSVLYAGNHGGMTHVSAEPSTRGHRPPRSSSNQMEAWEEDHHTRWRSKLSSRSGSPVTTIDGMSRRPSVVVTNHYVDIASLM